MNLVNLRHPCWKKCVFSGNHAKISTTYYMIFHKKAQVSFNIKFSGKYSTFQIAHFFSVVIGPVSRAHCSTMTVYLHTKEKSFKKCVFPEKQAKISTIFYIIFHQKAQVSFNVKFPGKVFNFPNCLLFFCCDWTWPWNLLFNHDSLITHQRKILMLTWRLWIGKHLPTLMSCWLNGLHHKHFVNANTIFPSLVRITVSYNSSQDWALSI